MKTYEWCLVVFAILLFFVGIIRKKKPNLNGCVLKCKKKCKKTFALVYNFYHNKKLFFDIQEKINYNLPNKFNSKIDVRILKNSGISCDIDLFKIYIENFDFIQKCKLFTIKKLQAKNKFELIIFTNEKTYENISTFCKKLNLKAKLFIKNDVNEKLLYEINKLNLNYKVENKSKIRSGIYINNSKIERYSYNNYLNVAHNIIENFEVVSNQMCVPKKDENIINFSGTDKYLDVSCTSKKSAKVEIKFVFPLQKKFVLVKKENNKIVLENCLGEKQFFAFSQNNFSFLIEKSEKNVFLSVIFKKSCKKEDCFCVMCICSNNNKIDLKATPKLNIFNCYCRLNKFFCVEFEDCSFSLKCKKMFLKCLLNNEKFEKCFSLAQFVNSSNKSLGKIYLSFIRDVLGLKIIDGEIFVQPKFRNLDFNFSIIYNAKTYKIELKSLGANKIICDGIEFVNLDKISLSNLKTKKIIFCS